jgi:hypothetical protein
MKLEEKTIKLLGSFRARKIAELNQNFSLLENALAKCESPLEQFFLVRAVDYFDAYPLDIQGHDPQFLSITAMRAPRTERFRLRIFPQRQINISEKNYRADFLFILERDERPFSMESKKEYLRLVVEVDGHNYHERTVDQSIRDKKRDRSMIREGY